MVIGNPTLNLAKYKNVYTVRQSDRKKLIATREDQDELLPARWTIETLEHPAHIDFSKVAFFKSPVMSITVPLTTEELVKLAQVEGYGDWQSEEEETAKS